MRPLAALACAALLGGLRRLAASSAGGEASSAGRGLLAKNDHRWQPGDEIQLFANKIGPFHNPRRAPRRATGGGGTRAAASLG